MFRKKIFLSILLLILSAGLFCQNDITLNISPSSVYYNYFPITNLDPENLYMPFFFSGSISNNTDTELDYNLRLKLTWQEDGDLIPNLLAEANNPLQPGETITITSKDILNDTAPKFSVDWDLNDYLNDEFEDQILELGALPDGNYIFELTALSADSGQEISDPTYFELEIRSPSPIQLIYPGSQNNINNQIFTQHPEFIWASNLNKYVLSIYELDEETDTAADIDNLPKFFTDTIENGVTSYTYPDNAPELEPGTLYAWRITSGLMTVVDSKDDIIESPIFLFEIIDEERHNVETQIISSMLNISNNDIRSELNNLLNNGYRPTGNIYFLGREISIDELQDLLNEINSGERTVNSIDVY